MKKLLLILPVVLVLALSSSCKKKGTFVCTKSILTITYKVTVYEDEYKECFLGTCSTYQLNGTTQEEQVEYLEADGYKCK